MRPPKVRFTIRMGMIGVAVVAVVFEGFVLVRRSREYHEYAVEHASDEGWYGMKADKLEGFITKDRAEANRRDVQADKDDRLSARKRDYIAYKIGPQAAWLAKGRDRYRTRAEFHGAMKAKYSRAAWRPWQAVPPDPTEPSLEMDRMPDEPRPPPAAKPSTGLNPPINDDRIIPE